MKVKSALRPKYSLARRFWPLEGRKFKCLCRPRMSEGKVGGVENVVYVIAFVRRLGYNVLNRSNRGMEDGCSFMVVYEVVTSIAKWYTGRLLHAFHDPEVFPKAYTL